MRSYVIFIFHLWEENLLKTFKSFTLYWLPNPSLIRTNHCQRQRSKAQIYNVQMYKLQMYMVKKMNNIGNTAQSSKLRRKTKNLIFHVFLTNPSKDDWLKLNQFALHWWNRGIWFLTEHSNDSADSLAVGPEKKFFLEHLKNGMEYIFMLTVIRI